MRRRSTLFAITASCLCLLLAGLHASCTAPGGFVSAWNLQLCDSDKVDEDCVDMPGSFCDAELGWCRCWNSDGTKPGPDEDSDQVYCVGSCRPVWDCPLLNDAGADAGPPCEEPSDCPQPRFPQCARATCTEGKCGIAVTPGELNSQIQGDCHAVYCDPLGDLVIFEDPGDYYDDGNECTIDMCLNGVWINKPHEGSCGDGYCFFGECVECVYDECKGSQLCEKTKCVPLTCADGIKNAGESEEDCGGPCAPCLMGAGCLVGSDCTSGVCTNNICQLSTCSDEVKNDSETDVDCGGPCGPCAVGKNCVDPTTDCVSKVCWLGQCEPPSCLDGIQNGDETGTDCGTMSCDNVCPGSP